MKCIRACFFQSIFHVHAKCRGNTGKITIKHFPFGYSASLGMQEFKGQIAMSSQCIQRVCAPNKGNNV